MARLTRTDAKLQEILHSKSTPDFSTLDYTAPDFNVRYGLALNWVHQAVEPDDLVREAQAYLTQAGRAHDAGLVKHVPFGVQQTMGKIAYCLNRGAQLSPRSHTYIDNGLVQAKRVDTEGGMDQLAQTSSGRLIEAYVACYARIDNLKTLVLKGKMDLGDMPQEVAKIVSKYGVPKVLPRLQAHYAEALAEAQSDKLIRHWEKPLKAIVRALSSGLAPEQPRKEKLPNKEVLLKGKKLKVKAKKSSSSLTSKPNKPSSGLSIASQVRELIRENKSKVNEAEMVEIVIKKLGLNNARGKSVVKAFWGKV